MKKLLMLVLALLCMVTAASADVQLRSWAETKHYQYVAFGQYPFERDLTVKPVVWRVLEVNDAGQALLMTDRVIEAYPYIVLDPGIDLKNFKDYRRISGFEESDLFPWMNSEMLNNLFTPEEQELLDDSRGKLFLLTNTEYVNVNWGFSASVYGTVRTRITNATPYAAKRGVYVQEGGCTYWTASIRDAEKGYQTQIVGYDGHMSWAGYGRRNVGLRPCVLVDTTRLEAISGEGTKDDPIVLSAAK